MTRFKYLLVTLCSAALVVMGASQLVACGETPAATWEHGEIEESEVTTSIENMRSLYGLSDDESWSSFVTARSYDPDADSKEGEGTVAELREYVINQLIRQDVIDYEIENQNITVSDEEVDAYVEQQREAVESQYMAGVFESYLEQQGYESIDDFREQAWQILAEEKLQEQVTGSTDDTDAWDEYVDGLVEAAQVTINDMPSGLSYDVTSTSSEESSSDDETTQDSQSTDDSAESGESGASE